MGRTDGERGRAFSTGSLVAIGKATTDVSLLESLPNVHLLGRKPTARPAYCKGFDVALMPFRVNELTLNANPLKAREYLAAGLQVVSTAIPEVEAIDAAASEEIAKAFCSRSSGRCSTRAESGAQRGDARRKLGVAAGRNSRIRDRADWMNRGAAGHREIIMSRGALRRSNSQRFEKRKL